MNGVLEKLLIEGATDLASFLWHKVRGAGSQADDEGKAAVARIKAAALKAAASAALAEAEAQAALLGIPFDLTRIVEGAQGVVEAFDVPSTAPVLSRVDIEEVPPEEWDKRPKLDGVEQ